MRRLALALLLLSACGKPSQIVVGVITNLQVPGALQTVQLEAYRNGVQVDSEYFSPVATLPHQPYALPGSFNFYSPGGGTPIVQLVLSGFGADPAVPIVQRMALVQYLSGEARFIRMALVQACVAGSPSSSCGVDETCIEGVCQKQAFDSTRLPRYTVERAHSVECDSGSGFIDTTTCTGSSDGGSCAQLPITGSCGEGQTCIEGTCYAM